MKKISNEIYKIIKTKDFADPFSLAFNSTVLLKECGRMPNKAETDLLEFLSVTNKIYLEQRSIIFTLFDKTKFGPADLREYLFIMTNKYFLDLTPKISQQFSTGTSKESENITFAKFIDEHGREINAQLSIEFGPDVLADLLSLSYQWKPATQQFDSITSIDPKKHDILFYYLLVCCSVISNIKKCAYDIVLYEKGIINIRKSNEILIEHGSKAIQFLKDVGFVRSTAALQQADFFALPLNKKIIKDKIGLVDSSINNNIISPIKGKSDLSIKSRSDTSWVMYYSYLSDEKLDYFDGLTFQDLLEIVGLIEECIKKMLLANNENYVPKELKDVPVKFELTKLTTQISEITGYNLKTINKVIDSITSANDKPYFWRYPFIKVDNLLYFTLAALAAPNHLLFLDQWTSLNGYSLEYKEEKFTKYFMTELIESKKRPYKFKIITDHKIKSLTNNILIETASLLILLEITLFDFPIEAREIDLALSRLKDATINIEKKAKKVLQKYGVNKNITKIVVTNYTTFSGLQINNIPISDVMLFENYVSIGKLRRTAISFQDEKPVITEGATIDYYKNENEFNNNLKSFFLAPIPIEQILKRLVLKEQKITPDIITPHFFVNNVDHISEEELMDSRMGELTYMLNYRYFGESEDKSITDSIDQSIFFSLYEIFSKISYSSYQSYIDRINLYHNISKTQLLGFIHLSFYIFNSIEKLNGKKIKPKAESFNTIEYNTEDAFELFKKIKEPINRLRLSEFKIEENTFTELEEKKILSLSIDLLSGLAPHYYNNDLIESLLAPLAFLNAFQSRYNIDFEFYVACGNIIDALNYLHRYQAARDLCEEILILSINNNKHAHGWNLLFKCYTFQRNTFDASINGCLFVSSISVLPEIDEYMALEILYGALKYFRNFGLTEFAALTYQSLQHLNLNEYDKQKVTLSYFNSFFQGEIQKDVTVLNLVLDYLEDNINDIVKFKENGVIPWLAMLYNIEKIKTLGEITYERDFKNIINQLENSVDNESIVLMKLKVLGDKDNPKDFFISALLNTYETRSVSDFVYEAQNLIMIARNLLRAAIITQDIDGILLAGIIINDQSFTFKEISTEPGSVTSFSKPVNEELKYRLGAYKFYVLANIKLTAKQQLIWLFEDSGNVYALHINSKQEFNIVYLENWEIDKSNKWLSNISNFYFNAKKDSSGNARSPFSNPRAEYDYNDLVQKEDYENLLRELSFANLKIGENIDEVFLYSSMTMSSFPHNLLSNNNDFIASKIAICNIVSLERFIEHHKPVFLNEKYTVSAWIPADDKEEIVSWGFKILENTLRKINARIYTSTYPDESISTDLNIFLAHGITDGSGFKAVYSNHAEGKAIAYPYGVFGQGKIAILFICNSGSSKESLLSNNIVSFSGELLKSGYESVIAPFWPFDVTMSRIWLDEFLNKFEQGYSVNESVWLANNQLSKYDEEQSTMYYAPAGCLAMHLYGNPNVYKDNSSSELLVGTAILGD